MDSIDWINLLIFFLRLVLVSIVSSVTIEHLIDYWFTCRVKHIGSILQIVGNEIGKREEAKKND